MIWKKDQERAIQAFVHILKNNYQEVLKFKVLAVTVHNCCLIATVVRCMGQMPLAQDSISWLKALMSSVLAQLSLTAVLQ